MNTLAKLTQEWTAWCAREELLPYSADELLATYRGKLSDEQRAYVFAFIARWEAAQRVQAWDISYPAAKFVARIVTEHTGGNVVVDVIHLRSGKLVVVGDEGFSIFDNADDWTGDNGGDVANGRFADDSEGFERNPEGFHYFVDDLETFEPDGPVSVDLLTLHDGQVIGIDTESVCVYPTRGHFDSMFDRDTPHGPRTSLALNP